MLNHDPCTLTSRFHTVAHCYKYVLCLISIILVPQFVSSGALFFFSFAWTSLRRGLPKERNESSEKEKKVKEKEGEEEGHINASLVLDETADQVSKLSGDIIMRSFVSCFMFDGH